MAYLEREITILSPECNSHFARYPQQWPIHYDEYDSDPLERVDRAREDRGEYYRRVESASRNFDIPDINQRAVSPGRRTLLDLVDDDSEMVVRKSISDGGPSIDSIPRVPEPHTSWRFYTSYDNGEWRRHMVPVHHSEEEVLSTSPSRVDRTRTESSSGNLSGFLTGTLSPNFGLETSIRRMRINRPSVYEALQSRRRRNVEGAKRFSGPRSPEMILNMSNYLPPDEMKRRYEVKDYVPKRNIEYGDRVIYPRVKSGSSSELESHHSFCSDEQRPRVDKNVEEVTRSIHPSTSLRSGFPFDFGEVIPTNNKPSNDFGFQEKVIIPTKYKTAKEREREDSLRRVDNKPKPDAFPANNFKIIDQQQQSVSQPRQQFCYPTLPQTDTRRTTCIHENFKEPSMNHTPRFEPGQRMNHFSSSLEDEYWEEWRSRRDGTGYESAGRLVPTRPQDKSRSQEREVKVVVVKNQPQDARSQKHEDKSGKNSKVDELASQVRSSTIDTMRQMESQMVQHMKEKCPEAADLMDSLVTGVDGKDMSMEKKEAFAEQVSLWQAGKPVEEKLNKETRYRSNNPTYGPQDFVERSSVSKGGQEMMQDARSYLNPFGPMKTDSRSAGQMDKKFSYATDRSRDSSYSRYTGGDDQSVFYSSGYPSPTKQADVRTGPYGFSGGQRLDYSQRGSHERDRMGQEERVYVPERKVESTDKIIIPTKYRQSKDGDPSHKMAQKQDIPEISSSRKSAKGQSNQYPRNSTNPKEGGLSEFAAFISKQFDASDFNEFDAIDGKLGSVQAETTRRSGATTQRERPVEVRRMGSLHDKAPSGEWEFDMAISEIPGH